MAGGLISAWPDGAALILLAAIILGLTALVRALGDRIPFYRWWLPAAAGATAAATGVTWALRPAGPSGRLAVAAALAGLALALSRTRPVLRVWSSAGVFALAAGLAMEATNLSPSRRPVLFGAAGLAVVVLATLWPRASRPTPGETEDAAVPARPDQGGRSGPPSHGLAVEHLAAVGHLCTLGALAAAPAGSDGVVTLGAWTLAWLVTTAALELGRSPFGLLLQRAHEGELAQRGSVGLWTLRSLPAITVVSSFAVLVVRAADRWTTVGNHQGWTGVVLALVALLYGALSHPLRTRRAVASMIALAGGVLGAIAVAVAAPAPWPVIEAAAASIAVVAVIPSELRHAPMTWFAWAMSGLLSVSLARRAGVPIHSLFIVSIAWGALLTMGGLALDDLRAGRRRVGEGVRIRALVPPIVLGTAALALSLAAAFTHRAAVSGAWSLVVAAVVLAIAVQLRAAALSGISYGLAAVAFAELVPWSPLATPWSLVLLAAVLAALAWTLEVLLEPGRTAPEQAGGLAGSYLSWFVRWDLPPLIVAHGVAVIALSRAVAIGSKEVTPAWVGFGILSLAVAAWRRNWAWAAAGVALSLTGAAAAGPVWMAIGLGSTAVASLTTAVFAEAVTRRALQAVGVAAAVAAWPEVVIAMGWTRAEAVTATSLASGGLALLVGAGLAARRVGREWATVLAAPAVAGFGGAAAMAFGPTGLAYVAGWGPGAGAGMFAAGAALAWRRTERPYLQTLTVVAAGWAWTVGIAGAGWSASRWVPVTALASGALALAASAGTRAGVLRRSWAVSLGVLGTAGLAAAFDGTLGSPPASRVAVGVGIALLGAAVGAAAKPFRRPWFRDMATGLALSAGAELDWAVHPSLSVQVWGAVVVGFAAMVGSLVLFRRRAGDPWLRPVALFGSGCAIASLAIAAAAWPQGELLVAALAVSGVEAAAVGLTLRRFEPLYASPVLLCAAWLLFAGQALTEGNRQWFTVPTGVAVLSVTELARAARRRSRRPLVTGELVALELVGIAFVVGAALLQTLARGPGYGLLAVLLGSLVVLWGGYTKVRRRAGAGVAVVLLAVALMIGGPVARLLPHFRGATLWASMAGIGAVLIVAATFLEQGRARVAAGVRRLSELLAGWE